MTFVGKATVKPDSVLLRGIDPCKSLAADASLGRAQPFAQNGAQIVDMSTNRPSGTVQIVFPSVKARPVFLVLAMHTFSIGQLRHLHSNTSCTQPARHIRGTQSHFDISRKTQESSAAAPSAARTQLLKLASAACLFLAPAQVHAADSTTLSFNKNCIGSLSLRLISSCAYNG